MNYPFGDRETFDFRTFYDMMADLMPDDCRVAEIGVAAGASAIYMAYKLYSLGKKFSMYMVDNFEYGFLNQMKELYENIIKSGLGEFITVVPYDSFKAADFFNGHSLDFVFIDSSHKYDETRGAIIYWYPKIKDNGYMGGHDFITIPDVHTAVTELFPEKYKRTDVEEAEEEDFLKTHPTKHNLGVWYLQKKFYFQPKV